MKMRSRLQACAVATLLVQVTASAANAACTIASITSLTPSTVATGTYTAPTAPGAVAFAIALTGTYTITGGSGTCVVALSFQRATLPASMTQVSGGTATLPYDIRSATGGGGNLLMYTTAPPAAANRATGSFSSNTNGTRTFTGSGTFFARMTPGSSQAGGSYLDTISFDVYDYSSGSGILRRAQSFTVTGIVTKTCTIGGVSTPTADSATIPITAAGAVNTAVITRSYGSVACNYPADLQLTSINGGVRNAGTAPSGFARIINYNSAATFSGASATLNTASNPAATGSESGTASATSSGTPSGTLAVTITPQANTQPLISGAYTDTLRITITPQ